MTVHILMFSNAPLSNLFPPKVFLRKNSWKKLSFERFSNEKLEFFVGFTKKK